MDGLLSVLGNSFLDKLLEKLTRPGWPAVLPLVRLEKFIDFSLSGRSGEVVCVADSRLGL